MLSIPFPPSDGKNSWSSDPPERQQLASLRLSRRCRHRRIPDSSFWFVRECAHLGCHRGWGSGWRGLIWRIEGWLSPCVHSWRVAGRGCPPGSADTGTHIQQMTLFPFQTPCIPSSPLCKLYFIWVTLPLTVLTIYYNFLLLMFFRLFNYPLKIYMSFLWRLSSFSAKEKCWNIKSPKQSITQVDVRGEIENLPQHKDN